MFEWTKDKATDKLDLCRMQKAEIEPICVAADDYYHNKVQNKRGVRPSDYVLQTQTSKLPFSNNIPFGVRVWLSVVLGAPYSIHATPEGDYGDGEIKKIAAEGINDYINKNRLQSERKVFIRRLATQALLYNQVFIYDGVDFNAKPYPMPFYTLVNWRDGYIDPPANEPLNDYMGPSWVAVRLWLRGDQAKNLYPRRFKDMKKGILNPDNVDDREKRIFDDLYPVIHWWGIDTEEIRITRREMRETIDAEWEDILIGRGTVTDEQPHRAAIEEGNNKFIEYVNEKTESEIEDDVSVALTRAAETGLAYSAQGFYQWRKKHSDYLDRVDEDGNPDPLEGGRKRKYQDGIYHVEFQEGSNEEPLLPPEPSPYKHGQLPISAVCRHEGTLSYWNPGVLAEALDKQQHIEFLEGNRDNHLFMQARAMFYAYRPALPERYQDPETGEDVFIADLMQGNKLMMLEDVGMDPSKLMGYLQPGAVSMDVVAAIREKKSEMMELFGASEVMRGMGPGAEASGKHIQLKMSAASKPSTFMLALLESPLHKHYERFTSNFIAFADPRYIAKYTNYERVSAIMALRQAGLSECSVDLNLGSGMPTEWIDRFQIYSQLVAMGIYPPQKLAEEMGIPAPSDEEMMQIMMANQQPPPGGGGAPQGPQGPQIPTNMGA